MDDDGKLLIYCQLAFLPLLHVQSRQANEVCCDGQQARRRRMHGVARLQEVPMPQLAAGAPEGGYTEDQFVVTLNKKVLEADQQRSAAI